MQKTFDIYKSYIKDLLHLAMPIIMGQIGFVLIMAGDVFVAARHSTDILSAVSISGAITGIIFMFGVGLMVSISPVLSNKLGAKESAKGYFYPTVKFSLMVSLLTTLCIFAIIPLIQFLGFDEKLLPDIKLFTFVFAFSSFGGFLFSALREFLQAYEIVVFPNLVAIIGIFLNILICWVLVFGFGVIPPLGILGLGLASVIVRTLMAISLLLFCFKKFNLEHTKKPKGDYYRILFQVGLPVSMAICIEMIAFNILAILMGRVSGIYAAAQNIINVVATTSFVIPLAISSAIAIKVGFANGAKQIENIKRYSIAGCLMSVMFTATCGILFISFPNQIAKIFTSDKALIDIIVPIMFILGCFQISDGLQASLGGVFKGLKKTGAVMLANFSTYIMIGIPLGAYLAFEKHLNLKGFWIGLLVASIFLATFLLIFVVKEYKKVKRANLPNGKFALRTESYSTKH